MFGGVYHSREAIKTLAFRAISRGTAARSLASIANLKCPTSSFVLFPVLALLYPKGIPADEDVCEMGSELGEPAPCHSYAVCTSPLRITSGPSAGSAPGNRASQMTRNGNVALASHRHSHESLLFTTLPHKAEQLGSEVAPGSLWRRRQCFGSVNCSGQDCRCSLHYSHNIIQSTSHMEEIIVITPKRADYMNLAVPQRGVSLPGSKEIFGDLSLTPDLGKMIPVLDW